MSKYKNTYNGINNNIKLTAFFQIVLYNFVVRYLKFKFISLSSCSLKLFARSTNE